MNPQAERHSRHARLRRVMPGAFVLTLMSLMILMNLILSASAARAVLQVGEAAPLFSRPTAGGPDFALDRKSNETVLLVFTKPGDRFTPEALRSLEGIFAKYPPLLKGMRLGIVLSRVDGDGQRQAFLKQAAPRWPVILDSGDELYKRYQIIATPTVVIIGVERKIAAVHAGYDLGLADDVRRALAQTRGMTLPEAMTGTPAKPNMVLQMGRRMAARGLWEDAVKYYGEAAKSGPLPVAAQLELAQIYLEMDNADAALAIINGLTPTLKQDERVKKMVQRAQAIKAGRTDQPKPPVIAR